MILADIGISAIALIGSYYLDKADPLYAQFIEGDFTISNIYKKPISFFPTIILLSAIPLLIVIVVQLSSKYDGKCSAAIRTVLSGIELISLIIFVSILLQNICGIARPSAFDLCKYRRDPSYPPCSFGITGELGSVENCLSLSKSDIRKAFRSFPCVESGVLMGCAILSGLIFINHINMVNDSITPGLRSLISLFFFIFCFGAFVLSSIFIKDKSNFAADVIAGYIIGAILALVIYNYAFGASVAITRDEDRFLDMADDLVGCSGYKRNI